MNQDITVRRALLVGVLALSAFLGACATASGPQFAGVQPAKPSKAQIYVYREEASFASGQAFSVAVDGGAEVDMPNASFLTFDVEPGERTVSVRPGGLAKSSQMAVSAKAGETQFLKFFYVTNLLANGFFIGSELQLKTADEAQAALRPLKAAK